MEPGRSLFETWLDRAVWSQEVRSLLWGQCSWCQTLVATDDWAQFAKWSLISRLAGSSKRSGEGFLEEVKPRENDHAGSKQAEPDRP